MIPRLCLAPRCPNRAAPGDSRCDTHRLERDRPRWQRNNARRRAIPGDGASARLRSTLNATGHGTCATCGRQLPANELHVDHRQALADGGTDTADNVQALCIPDHTAKTRAEALARNRARRSG